MHSNSILNLTDKELIVENIIVYIKKHILCSITDFFLLFRTNRPSQKSAILSKR